MAQKLITIDIDEETSEFSIDLTGFQGQGCGEISQALCEVGEVLSVKKKPEYNQKTCNVQRK